MAPMLFPRAPYAWLWLSWAVLCAPACKSQCPPLSIQEGQYCRWTHDDAGVAGGSGQAGKAGASAGRAGSLAVSAWTCTQVDDACTCTPSEGGAQDGCNDPKPSCCYAYAEEDGQRCSCVPAETAACTELASKGAARMLGTCPP